MDDVATQDGSDPHRVGELVEHATSETATWVVDGREKVGFTWPELEALVKAAGVTAEANTLCSEHDHLRERAEKAEAELVDLREWPCERSDCSRTFGQVADNHHDKGDGNGTWVCIECEQKTVRAFAKVRAEAAALRAALQSFIENDDGTRSEQSYGRNDVCGCLRCENAKVALAPASGADLLSAARMAVKALALEHTPECAATMETTDGVPQCRCNYKARKQEADAAALAALRKALEVVDAPNRALRESTSGADLLSAARAALALIEDALRSHRFPIQVDALAGVSYPKRDAEAVVAALREAGVGP